VLVRISLAQERSLASTITMARETDLDAMIDRLLQKERGAREYAA
jgi:hypothetical protein